MSSRPHRYNRIDDALHLRSIHFIFNDGLSYVDTSKHYSYPYETIRSIARAFEDNGQLVSKHRGGVRYPILQVEHIQGLVERLEANTNMTIESLHRQLNEVFQIPRPISINCVSKAI